MSPFFLNQFLAKDPARRFGQPAAAAAALEPFSRGADLRRLFASLGSQSLALEAKPTEDYSPGG
jgi:hypothetical protein